MELQDVEQTPRLLFISGVVVVSSILSLICVVRRSSVLQGDKIYLMFGLFLLINCVSFFRSINYGDGLFEMLKIMLLYSLFFQFVLVFSGDEKNKQILFKSIGVSSLVFIVFGISQLLPLFSDFISKGTPLRINYAIASTLGNKNFFAETVFMMLPLTILGAISHRSVWRFLFIITSALIVVTLALLQTLSTWAAMFVVASVLVVLLFKWHKKIFVNAKSSRLFYLGTAGVILAVMLSGFIFLRVAGTSLIKSRITTVQNIINPATANSDSLNQNSTYERISLWKNSIKMTADHPVMGVGLGNWKIIAPSHGIGSAAYMTTGVIRFVHPHNDFLLIASESGLVGLLIFISLLGWLFYYCLSLSAKAKNASEIVPGLVMMFGLAGYVIIALVSLPSSRIYPLLMFLIIAALIISEHNRQRNSTSPIGKKILIPLFLLSFTTAVASAYIGNKRLAAEFNLSAALLQERKKNFDAMKRQLANINRKYYPLDATATPIAWYLGYAHFYTGDQETAFALFKEAEQANPYHLMVLNDLGTCYNLSGDAATAMEYYNKTLTIQPGFGNTLTNVSIIYFNAGQLDSAFSTLIKYKDNIKIESLPVFNTIILAKATTITQDSVKLDALQARMKHPVPLKQLLNEIQEEKGNLSAIISK